MTVCDCHLLPCAPQVALQQAAGREAADGAASRRSLTEALALHAESESAARTDPSWRNFKRKPLRGVHPHAPPRVQRGKVAEQTREVRAQGHTCCTPTPCPFHAMHC